MAVSFLNQTQTANNYIQGLWTISSMNLGGGFSFWFYPVTVSGHNRMFSIYDADSTDRISVGVDSSTTKVVLETVFSTTVTQASASTYTANAWNHVMFNQTGSSTYNLWLNDDAGVTNTGMGGFAGTAANGYILGGTWNGLAIVPEFEGYLAEVCWWNNRTSPTAALRTALYKGSKPERLRTPGLGTGVYLPLIRNYQDMRETTTTINSSGTNLTIAPHVRRYG